jgi:hypothetical protein
MYFLFIFDFIDLDQYVPVADCRIQAILRSGCLDCDSTFWMALG